MLRSVLTIETLPVIVDSLITESGMHYKEISQKSGIGEDIISVWRRGKGNPRTEHFLWFLDSLGYRLVVERKK